MAVHSWVRGVFGKKTGTVTRDKGRTPLGLEPLGDRINPTQLQYNLFDTAVDATGAILTSGADAHYTVGANPDGVAAGTGAEIATNDFGTGYIATSADQTNSSTSQGGTFEYTTTFDLPAGTTLTNATLSGLVSADDSITDILLNGTSTGLSFANGFQANPFSIDISGLVAGSTGNTLTFVANNLGGAANNPTGLKVADLVLNVAPPAGADAPPVLTGGGTPATADANGPAVAVDPSLTLTAGTAATLDGATVRITGNFTAGDQLLFTNQNGITGTYDANTGVLTLTGTDTVANYEAALRSVQIQSTAGGAGARTVTFSVVPAGYTAFNGHFYQYVGGALNWGAAEAAAAGINLFGVQGYLATIRSADENAAVTALTGGNAAWFGASDSAAEGVWQWVTGPDAGVQFWQGGVNGAAVNGEYSNWDVTEPNNGAGNLDEDYAHTVPSGATWNDNNQITAIGYLVEYGDSVNDPTLSLTSTATVNVTPQTAGPTVTDPAAATSVNTATFTVTGTAAADSLVRVYSDANNDGIINGADAVVASVQLMNGDTDFSIPVTLTTDADNDFLVTATAPGMVESAPVDVPTVTQDSTGPNTTTVTSPAAATTVNAATFTVTGVAEAGSLVQVYSDANNDGIVNQTDAVVASQQLAPAATSYSIPVNLTQNADNNFVVTATDAVGNEGTAVNVPTITEDSTGPNTTTVTSPAAATSVNAVSFTVTGTAEAGSLVRVYSDANNDGIINGTDAVVASQQLAPAATSYSIPVTLAQDADNNFVVTATDTFGNEGTAVNVPTITEDSTGPTGTTVGNPAGTTTVNAATFTVTGVAEAGSLVQVYSDANNDGIVNGTDAVVASQQLAPAATNYSIPVTLTRNADNNFVVTATDTFGNEGTAVNVPTITEDSTAPAGTTVTSPAAATAVNTATFTVTGTAEAGSLVKVYSDANNDGIVNGADAVVAQQQLGAGVTGYSISVTLTQNADNNFLVTATDATNNQGTPVDVPTITQDAIAPAGTTVTTPAAATTVNATTATVAGVAAANSLVRVYSDANNDGIVNGTDAVVAQQQLTGGATGYSITVPLTPDVANNFLVTATDAAGNQGSPVDVPTVTEDSTIPTTPTVTGPAAAQTVNAASTTVSGTAETGSLVQVYRDANNNGIVDAGDTVVASQQLAAGATAFSIAAPLTRNAANNFIVTATDLAGNASAAATVPTVTEDSTPVAAPVVTGPAGRVATTADTFTLTGTAEAGSSVAVYEDANRNGVIDPGEAVVGTQQLAAGQTAFSIDVALDSDSVNRFLVTAFDAAGNGSAAVAVPNVVQGSPDAGVPRGFAAGSDEGGRVAILYNSDGTVRLRVEPFPGTGGVRVAAADVNGDGVTDLVVGSGPGILNQVKVYDGATGKVIQDLQPFEGFTGGVFVEAADLNGDGKAEVIITPDQGGGPRVQIVDGASGKVLMNFFGIDDPGFRGGARVAAADMNGDGVADLFVAAGFGGGPRVAGYDGKALAGGTVKKLFNDIFIFEDVLRNGVYLAAGDINGDGFADLIAGGGPGGGPRVYALSGKDLLDNKVVQVANFFGGDPASRNGIRVSTADIDLDEKTDIVVGAGKSTGSKLNVYLGKDIPTAGTPPAAQDITTSNDPFGIFVG